MTPAQHAYKEWKAQHKVNLQVYTDEQMFILGYDSRETEVKDLTELLVDALDRLNSLQKPKRVKKSDENS
jgi:lipid A disaccharide synthetase